jgi:hypothetical protein
MKTYQAFELSKAFGMLHDIECFGMYTLAAMVPEGGVVINVGAGFGTSGLCFAEAGRGLNLTTVDITNEGNPFGGLGNERNAFDQAGLPYPKQIHSDSHKAGRDYAGPKADCIFIDADHSEAGCRGDIEAWYPHLKPGGFMAFHDYDSINWADVKRVIDEWIGSGKLEFVYLVDTTMVTRKAK